MIRTRVAPAASNHLSLRELQCALVNWLMARAKGGQFFVRIGDLDLVRGRAETVHRILDDLRWLDLDWEEGPDTAGEYGAGGEYGPYLQSQRRERYVEPLERLEKLDAAYACSEEHADAVTVPEGLREPVSKALGQAGAGGWVVRFALDRSGDGVEWKDLVHGATRRGVESTPDPIIRRADGTVSPFLASVVDDAAMKVTHVLRPASDVGITEAEIVLHAALGHRTPRFGHFPSLTGPDGNLYTRRHGAFTVDSFKKLGYLPITLANYLAWLAWTRRGLGRKFDPRDLGEKFHVGGIRKASVPFSFPEMNRLSTEYLGEEHLDHLVDRALPYLIEGRFVDEDYDREGLKRILATIRPSLKCLSEIVKYVDIFFGETVIESRGREVLKDEGSSRFLQALRDQIAAAASFEEDDIRSVTSRVADEAGVDEDRVVAPLRVALTGVPQDSDDVHKIASVLGRRGCLEKIDRVLGDVVPHS